MTGPDFPPGARAGQQLGHAQSYTAVVHMQGGRQVFATVEGATQITWGRKLDDYSEASVTVAKADAGARCCGKLGQVHTWGHELSIYRDGVFVWQGPIVNKIETSTEFVFEARDVLAYLDRRPALGIYNWTPPDEDGFGDGAKDSAYIAGQVMRNALGWPGDISNGTINDRRLDPNLWNYALIGEKSGVQATFQQLLVGENYAADVLRDMAEYGLDLYAMARHICLIPTVWKREWRPIRLTEHAFLADLEVRENGLDAATLAVVVGTQPQNQINGDTQQPSDKAKPAASWPHYNTNENRWVPRVPFDPFYGFIGQTGSSQSATTNAQCRSLAQQVVQYGYPAPIDIVTPDGAQLSPTAPVGIQQLVPGYPVIVALESFCSPVAQQRMEINEVEVQVDLTTDGMTEAVQVSLASGPTPLDEWQGGGGA